MLSIEGAHLPKHQNSWIHVPVRSNALQDEFLQNQYISLVRCDLEGCRIAFYETEDYTSCIVSHRRDESWPGNTVYFCCFGACFCALATMCILSKGSSLEIQTLHNCKKIPEDNRSQNHTRGGGKIPERPCSTVMYTPMPTIIMSSIHTTRMAFAL